MKTLSSIASLVIMAVLMASCAIKPVPAIYFHEGRWVMLTKDLVWRIENTDKTLVIPAGFVTDFASIPKSLWWWNGPTGAYQWSAVVHDYLYWVQVCDRDEADALLLRSMKEEGVSWSTRSSVYRGVRVGGEGPWEDNAREKQSGEPRFVPEGLREIPALVTWASYRQTVKAALDSRREAPVQIPRIDPSICTLPKIPAGPIVSEEPVLHVLAMYD